jgi:flagella basal body P-ring formation protein FlgA
MKCGKWICLIVIGLMILSAGNVFSNDKFKSLLYNEIINFYDLNDADIEVEIRSNRLDTDTLAFDSLSIKSLTRSKPRGLLGLQVSLYNGGQEIQTGQIRVKIDHYASVLVATDRIGRHKPITNENSRIERMEITSLTAEPLTSDDGLADLWTKRDIRKDQILSSNSVEKIPTILSGQGVSILYKTTALEISSRGIAMESGYAGEKIRIKNEHSNKILTCTVLDGETVEVAAN